jgi:hypothetical protein
MVLMEEQLQIGDLVRHHDPLARYGIGIITKKQSIEYGRGRVINKYNVLWFSCPTVDVDLIYEQRMLQKIEIP